MAILSQMVPTVLPVIKNYVYVRGYCEEHWRDRQKTDRFQSYRCTLGLGEILLLFKIGMQYMRNKLAHPNG